MANNSQEPNVSRKEGLTKGQMIDTAADVAEYFSKDEPKVIHCTACREAEKQGKFAKAATVFSLGALVLSAVSLGMQLLREPTSIFESEQWEEMKDLIEKIPARNSSSSSSVQAGASSSSSTRIVTIPYVPPAASSKSSAAAMPSSTPQSSVEAVAVTSSRPPSSISSTQSSTPSSVAVSSADSSVTKPVETSSAAPADAGGAAEPAVTGSRI